MKQMKYSINNFTKVGLEARWTKKNGEKIIVARDPVDPRGMWWYVDKRGWNKIQEGERLSIVFDQYHYSGCWFTEGAFVSRGMRLDMNLIPAALAR